jgi:hypothetical protein
MLNPQPHISTHEPWIWRQFAQQLPLDTVRTGIRSASASPRAALRLPSWSPGELVATHAAYAAALRTIGVTDPRIVAMEGDDDSSSYAQVFPAPTAGRPFEIVVADQRPAAPEQQMIAAAIALQARAQIPFAAGFADSWSTPTT